MGWDWETRDNHGHPINTKYADAYHNDKETGAGQFEFHKIGEGNYWCFGHGTDAEISQAWQLEEEHMMTLGVDANPCASIFQEDATLKQTISGLRPGNYIVYCRGFYSPVAMEDFSLDDSNNPTYTQQQLQKLKEGATNGRTFLFAQSANGGEKQMRRLPFIFEGLTSAEILNGLSKESFVNSDKFLYTQLGFFYSQSNHNGSHFGVTDRQRREALLDKNVFAIIRGTDLGEGYDANQNYYLPKTVAGAGRFFDAKNHKQAQNYRIGLPVKVLEGGDGTGELTIGVEHHGNNLAGEWVCFDEFELVYLGKDAPDEFIIDEDIVENNTICSDLFGTSLSNQSHQSGNTAPVTVKVVIHRTMLKDTWNPIVLPVSLTGNQVKEAFGNDTKLSELEKLEGTTLKYKAVSLNGDEIAMKAGQPYIIMPSDFPVIPEGAFYYRNPQEKTENGVTTDFFVDAVKRNEILTNDYEGKISGPIYIIDNYSIDALKVFPSYNQGIPAVKKKGADEWCPVEPKAADHLVRIVGDTSGKTYRLKAKGFYHGTSIPEDSYYHSGGNMYYTGNRSLASDGFRAYVQLEEEENGRTKGHFKEKFINGNYVFEEIEDKTSITSIGSEQEAALTIYNLQGCRVTNPENGVYIVNGKKVTFRKDATAQ